MASELMLSEVNSDVTLKVRHDGYSWRMPAHSLLLVTKSSVFEEMLDERADEAKPISIPFIGVKPVTALAVLNHIYNDKFPPDVSTDLFIASKKYNLASLRDNLEERFMSDLTLIQACRVFDELYERQPLGTNCVIKAACQEMIEMHAMTVFGSDMVLLFGKVPLTELLKSSQLNVPDESYVFWGVWRWCRRHSSKSERTLTDENVAVCNDDLIVLIRCKGLKNRLGIPPVASARFNKCQCYRTAYCCPPDMLKHTSSFRPCPTWEDVLPPKISDDSEVLCVQLSFEKDVLFAGMTLEACLNDPNITYKLESVLRVIRESDCVDIRRQKVSWCLTGPRRTSIRGDPESRLECELTLKEPVFLKPGQIYSVYLNGNFSRMSFLWSSAQKKRFRIGNTFVNIHGEGISTVREIHLVPDMTVSWGERGLEM